MCLWIIGSQLCSWLLPWDLTGTILQPLLLSCCWSSHCDGSLLPTYPMLIYSLINFIWRCPHYMVGFMTVLMYMVHVHWSVPFFCKLQHHESSPSTACCSVRQELGPVWAYSCFSFESMNHHIKSLFHGSTDMSQGHVQVWSNNNTIVLQLAFNHLVTQSLPNLITLRYFAGKDRVQLLMQRLGRKKGVVT